MPLINNRNLNTRNLIASYVAWWAAYIVIQTVVLWQSFDLDPWLAFQDALLTNTTLALAGYTMINFIRSYQPRQLLRLIDSVGLAIASMLATTWLAKQIIDDQSYHLFLDKSLVLRCFFAWIMISLFAASASLWFQLREQREIDARKAASEKLAKDAELARLRQQLQPHFLFNSLNSISALAGSDPEQARKMIQQLSDFLRGTLRKDDNQQVTLQEELEHLQLYLDIEKVRFGHRLKTHIETHENTLTAKLPALLLQPVLENAIKFGLYDTTGEIVVRLKAHLEANYLHLIIENPYDKETAAPRQGTGFGLNSIQRRLHLLYARQDLVTTSSDDITFTTTIKIPQSA